MYEGCCKKDSSTEVSREEKEAVRYRKVGETASNYGKGACYVGSVYRAIVAWSTLT